MNISKVIDNVKQIKSGYDISDESYTAKFDVKSMTQYRVSEGFPRITEKDIQRAEICDVDYSLILNALKPYMED